MRKAVSVMMAVVMVVFFSSVAFAGSCTKADVKAAVDEISAMLEKEGRAGLVKIPGYRFAGGNYVYVGDMDCTIIAHGFMPHLVGKNIIGIKDDTGFKFMAKLLEGIKSSQATKNGKTYYNGETWVKYRWPSPEDKTKFQNKLVYAKGCLMGNENVFVTAGMYE